MVRSRFGNYTSGNELYPDIYILRGASSVLLVVWSPSELIPVLQNYIVDTYLCVVLFPLLLSSIACFRSLILLIDYFQHRPLPRLPFSEVPLELLSVRFILSC